MLFQRLGVYRDTYKTRVVWRHACLFQYRRDVLSLEKACGELIGFIPNEPSLQGQPHPVTMLGAITWATSRGCLMGSFFGGIMTRALTIAVCALMLVLPATAQKGGAQKGGGSTTSNLPVVNSLSPSSKEAGSGTFIMTVTGTKFTTGSVVRWNGTNISTGYVSSSQMNASVSSSYIASTGTASVTVFTSGRKGGTSNTVSFTITQPTTTTSPPPPAPAPSPTPLSITTTSLPGITVNGSFSSTVAATGGTPAYGWSLVNGGGSMPPGLVLQTNGTISGTPSQSGTFTFTTQADDQASQVAQKVLSITVAADPNATTTTTTTTSSGSHQFQNNFDTGDFSGWSRVAGKIAIDSSRSLTAPNSGKLNFYYCGDSTNTACGPQVFSAGGFFERTFNASNGYPTGLSEFYFRGFVLHHINPGGMSTGDAGRKLLYLKSATDYSSTGWGPVLTTWADSRGLMLTFITQIAPVVQVNAPKSYYSLGFMQFDQWACVELYVRANTPGLSDGDFKMWLNGTLVKEGGGTVDMRGKSTMGITIFEVGRQVSRLNWATIDEDRYWDNVVISTTGPIGCSQ